MSTYRCIEDTRTGVYIVPLEDAEQTAVICTRLGLSFSAVRTGDGYEFLMHDSDMLKIVAAGPAPAPKVVG